MKTRFLLGLAAVAAFGGVLFTWPAIAQPATPSGSKASVEIPVGTECVVTVEMQTWMNVTPVKPDPISGFHPDYTLRGKVVHWGTDWVVLKDGTYENWISRDKVLSVRVSR